MVSLLAFVAVEGAGMRSFQTWDNLRIGLYRLIILNDDCIVYAHASANSIHHSPLFDQKPIFFEERFTFASEFPSSWNIAGFWGGHLKGSRIDEVYFGVPLWPLLLLLLVAPVRWLMARPANAPAFPVVTDTKPRFG